MSSNSYYKYQIFDSTLEVDAISPELMSSRCQSPAITICRDTLYKDSSEIIWFHNYETPEGQVSISCGKSADCYQLEFPGLARFRISRDLKTVRYTTADTTAPEVLRHLLLDQIIPRMYGHHYQTVIHASAIEGEGRVVLFIGPSGIGKSTLAASLHRAGLNLLSDDCVYLKKDILGYRVIPAYSGIRLWRDSAEKVDPNHNYLKDTKIGKYGKYRMSVRNGDSVKFNNQLVSIVVLNPMATNEKMSPLLTPLAKVGIIPELLKNSFTLDITDEKYLQKQLIEFSRLANGKNENFQFNYPRCFESLDKVVNYLCASFW
ncbi:MAG: hypothetical protein ACI8P9_001103 [Parasphingorhabdus sp.]|jgi:hypothetical protein